MNQRDGILALVLLAMAGAAFLIFGGGKGKTGDQAVIIADGAVYGTYRLDQEKEIEIKTEYGTNTIVIKDGRVYMKNADCPDEYCVKQGTISRSKETIVCLPHKLVVEVKVSKKEEKEKEIDVIAK